MERGRVIYRNLSLVEILHRNRRTSVMNFHLIKWIVG